MNIRRMGMACVIGAAAAVLAGCNKDWRLGSWGRPPAAATTQPASSDETIELTEAESAAVEAINWERLRRLQRQLRVRAELVVLAREHSRDMAAAKRASDVGSDGSTLEQRAQRAGLGAAFLAQTVYGSRVADRPGKDAVKAWMSSEPHRKLLLGKRYQDIGVGVSRCPETGAHYVTAVFRDPEKP